MNDILISVLSAFIGGCFVLIGTYISFRNQRKEANNERIMHAKPIMINVSFNSGLYKDKQIFDFYDKNNSAKEVFSAFKKNTDNGIAFIDYIQTESNEYYPMANATVDKNTYFRVDLHICEEETLKTAIIHCHDVLENRFYYECKFIIENSEIEIQKMFDVEKR